MTAGAGWFKARRRLVGVAFLAVLATLVALSVAVYGKVFTPVVTVVLHTGNAGNEMHPHAEVKVRGVVVGEVRSVSADGDGARLELAIQPGKARRLPANVSAQLLPTTLFGERYVALMMPADPDGVRLADGAVIGQDRSRDAIELQRVLDDLLPMLRAVQPQKLSVTLTAVARALEGRGAQLGRTLAQVNSYLRGFNPSLPQLDRDISELVEVLDDYDRAAPDLVRALSEFTVTSRTIVEQRANLEALYSSVTGTADDLTSFLRANRNNIIRLSADSRSTLRVLARYAPEFPCVLKQLTDLKPAVDAALGEGTDEPGLHVTVHVVPSLGRYVPGRDSPVYGDHSGPHCYRAPFPGVSLNDGASPPTSGAQAPVTASRLANSPQENEFVNELVAPVVDTPPRLLPGWSSLLVGPLFRGTEVVVR